MRRRVLTRALALAGVAMVSAAAPAAAQVEAPADEPAAPAAAPPAATPSPVPATPAGGDASSPDGSVALLAFGGLAAAAALALLAFALLRRLGVADDRLAAVGHSWREARWRAGGTWQDFRDWVRTGR